MTGGVDSAVAAALAVDAGHDVTGVHLALSPDRQTLRTGARGCCSVEDAHDARRVADVLGIPFYVWDMADRFPRTSSTTSSPSTRPAGRRTRACAATRRSSSPRCSTGRWRWASTRWSPATTPGWPTGAAALRRPGQGPVVRARRAHRRSSWPAAMFPLGATTKAQVRREAAARGLAVADKPDSHDICFIADGDTRGFLAQRLGSQPGPIVDAATGAVVGRARRRRTPTRSASARASASRSATRRPRYVLSITPVTHTVTVGPADLAGVTGATGPSGLDRRRRRARPGRVPRCSCGRTARRWRARWRAGATGGCASRSPRAARRRRGPGGRAYRPDPGAATRARAGAPSVGGGVTSVAGDCVAGRWPRPASGRCPAPTSPRRSGSCSASCPTCRTCPSCPAAAPGADMIGRPPRCSSTCRRAHAGRLAGGPAAGPRPAPGARPAGARPRRAARAGRRVRPARSRCRRPGRGRWPPASSAPRRPVLRDDGAGRDLAESLAEGLRAHVADVAAPAARRRRPAAARRAVAAGRAAGRVPTESGFGALRPVEATGGAPELAAWSGRCRCRWCVHCCAHAAPLGLLRRGRRRGGLDRPRRSSQELDPLGEAIDAGAALFAGVVPGTAAAAGALGDGRPGAGLVAEARLPRRLAAAVTVTPTCGLAGATPGYARAAMTHVTEAAKYLQPE